MPEEKESLAGNIAAAAAMMDGIAEVEQIDNTVVVAVAVAVADDAAVAVVDAVVKMEERMQMENSAACHWYLSYSWWSMQG